MMRDFDCELCGASYPLGSMLNQHIEEVHYPKGSRPTPDIIPSPDYWVVNAPDALITTAGERAEEKCIELEQRIAALEERLKALEGDNR